MISTERAFFRDDLSNQSAIGLSTAMLPEQTPSCSAKVALPLTRLPSYKPSYRLVFSGQARATAPAPPVRNGAESVIAVCSMDETQGAFDKMLTANFRFG